MMKNKAQATLYIIIGIVIAALIIGAVLLSQQKVEEAQSLELSPVKNYVDNCIDKVAVPGIYLLGLQGGQIFIDRDFVNTTELQTVYGYYEGSNVLVSKREMEEQISRYMELQLPNCLSNFDPLTQEGTQIKQGNITAETTISENEIKIDIDFPVSVKSENSQKEIKEFSRDYKIRLGHVHDVANALVEKQKENPERVDLTYMSSFDVQIDLSLATGESLLYKIHDPLSTEKEQPFLFIFGVHEKRNKNPELLLEEVYRLKDDRRFVLDIKVEDDDTIHIFKADTGMFTIKNSRIDFVPKVTGEFNVTIYVEDPEGAFDEKTVRFIIEE